jgi:hypothetical protein
MAFDVSPGLKLDIYQATGEVDGLSQIQTAIGICKTITQKQVDGMVKMCGVNTGF